MAKATNSKTAKKAAIEAEKPLSRARRDAKNKKPKKAKGR